MMQIKENLEIWKDIPGYEGKYQASNLGNIKSLRRNLILKARFDKCGYLRLGLYKGKKQLTKFIHQIVAETFIEKNNDTLSIPEIHLTVDHVDRNKLNNCIYNLRWLSRSENSKREWDDGIKIRKNGGDA